MNGKMSERTRVALAAGVIALATAALVYAALPPPNVGSNTVPLGTLADLPVNVLSVDAFTRTITPNGQTNVVLQHLTFAPNQSTGWHTHPGPAFALVNAGAFTLTDEHCDVTTYGPGQGFATGLDVHEAVAGPDGADFYAFYFLPEDATVLRTNADPPVCTKK